MKKILRSQTKKRHQPNPLTKKEEVAQNPDNKIDEDFVGYPHSPSQKEMINPKSKENKIAANVNSKDGKKRSRQEIDESRSDGSANAFEGTEELRDDE
jgi:hypothetical protein